LGVHISSVKSTTLDKWQPKWIETCARIGNRVAAAYYEKNMPPNFTRPTHLDGVGPVENFIRAKYVRKEYAPRDSPAPHDLLAQGRDPAVYSGKSTSGSGTQAAQSAPQFDAFADLDFANSKPTSSSKSSDLPDLFDNISPKKTSAASAAAGLDDFFAPVKSTVTASAPVVDQFELLKKNLGQAYHAAAPVVPAAAATAPSVARPVDDWFGDFSAPAAKPQVQPQKTAPPAASDTFDPFADLLLAKK
jgi:hypothetical protein